MTVETIMEGVLLVLGWMFVPYFAGAFGLIACLVVLKVVMDTRTGHFTRITSIKGLAKIWLLGALIVGSIVWSSSSVRDGLKKQIRNGEVKGYSYQSTPYRR